MAMPTELEDIPEDIIKSYPSKLDNKDIKKKIRCFVMDAKKGFMPTLVEKPRSVKYGAKWFVIGGFKYFINYTLLKNFGKYYGYFTQFGNSVGGMAFSEYEEFADANQIELMTNQHAVEVFKKNRGIQLKLLLIIGIVAAVLAIGLMIATQYIIGVNKTLDTQKTQITTLKDANKILTDENTLLKESLGGTVIEENG